MKSLRPWLALLTLLIASNAHARGDASWFNNRGFQRKLDRTTRSRAHRGNQVKLLVNGVTSYRQRQRNVAEADIVLLKTYNFRQDETGKRVVQWLEDRLARGKQVFVQFDVKGATKSPLALLRMWRGKSSPLPPMLQRLMDRGAVIIPTNAPTKLEDCNPIWGKDHEKYLVTWRQGQPVRAIMGGMNVGDEWAKGGDTSAAVPALHGAHGFRDTDIQVQGPVTRDIVREFLADARHHGRAYLKGMTRRKADPLVQALLERLDQGLKQLEGAVARIDGDEQRAYAHQKADATCRFVANRPLRGESGQHIENLFSEMLRRAPAVTLSNAFFLPTERLLDDVKGAVERDAPSTLLLNGTDAVEKGFRIVAKRARKDYRYLMSSPKARERLKIFEWHGDAASGVSSIHHKLMAFGDQASDPYAIGSSNLDFHSLRRNAEGVLLVQDPTTKRQLDQMLKEDLAKPGVKQVQPEELPGRFKLFLQGLFPPRSWL